jgi:hypothetical protein
LAIPAPSRFSRIHLVSYSSRSTLFQIKRCSRERTRTVQSLTRFFLTSRQHLQKLRRKEDKTGNGTGAGGDVADNKNGVGTPKAKAPRKRATPASKATGSGKRGRKAQTEDGHADDGGDDDEADTPSKKPKLELKE